MGSIKMSIDKLIETGIIPESMKEDPVIITICNQTKMSMESRKAFIVIYVAVYQGNE